MGCVLVVAAHPDDELLGCGGTVARHIQSGDEVHVLILAEGAASRFDRRDQTVENRIDELRTSAAQAAELLGLNEPRFGGLPDNRMDGLDLLDVVKIIETCVRETSANTVYTHHSGDLNVDHLVTHKAVVTACRPLPGMSVSHIYAFETPSSTEWVGDPVVAFGPRHFVNVADYLDLKLKALSLYENEMRSFPHPRSLEAVENLARYRGSSVGISAAEAFEVVRQIER